MKLKDLTPKRKSFAFTNTNPITTITVNGLRCLTHPEIINVAINGVDDSHTGSRKAYVPYLKKFDNLFTGNYEIDINSANITVQQYPNINTRVIISNALI
jgi:hypothetical protein